MAKSIVDLESLIERQKLGGFLLVTLAMGVLVQLFEGFDLVAAGVVGPAIAKAFGIERAQLGLIFSAFFMGLVVGSLILGVIGDLWGRKAAMIVGTLWYGVFSIATVGVHTVGPLVALRFLTGVGLGGVLPTTIALMCEYAPSRMRGVIVNIMICGLNVGGAIGGFAGAHFIPIYGWQFIFYAGGIAPIAMVPFFLAWFPESARFLRLRGEPPARIAAIVRRIDPALPIGPETEFVARDLRLKGLPVRHLFARGWAVATVLLWVTMALNQVLIGFFTQYLPTMLDSYGLGMRDAVRATGVFQVGAVLGTILLGWLIDRKGYFTVLAAVYLGAFACALLMVSFGLAVGPIMLFALGAGVCVAGGQNTINALSGAFYPTLARSTGSGWALGVGRIGAVIGIPAAGLLLGLKWPVPAIFATIGAAGLAAMVTILLMRRQALRSPEIRAAQAFETAPAASTA
jgi:AAHS family 4-hydroxybenzoate transporter-like MFS transporter